MDTSLIILVPLSLSLTHTLPDTFWILSAFMPVTNDWISVDEKRNNLKLLKSANKSFKNSAVE